MKQLKEFNELPRQHSRINPTGKPTKYWVAVDEYSQSLNIYSQFVMPNLQLKDIGNNATPPTTVDKRQAVQLAKRAIQKFPGYYVFVGQDKSSHGMMTGKDHLRASVLYIWDPNLRMWNDNVDEKEVNESLSEAELSESTSDEDIINTAFSTLLYFLTGEGNVVLKDDEWMNYLQNDINAAIQKGMFKPSFADKQHIKKLQEIRLGEDEENTDDEEIED